MKNSVIPLNEFKEKDLKNQAWDCQTSVRRSLRPLLFCLKVAGLLHTINVSRDPEPEIEVHRNCCNCGGKYYAILVILLLWYNFGFSLVSFKDAEKFDGVVCNEIITSIWFLQVAAVVINNYRKCKLWDDLIKQWNEMTRTLDMDIERTIHKSAVIATVLYGVWVACASAFTAAGSVLNPALQNPIPDTSNDVAITFRVIYIVAYLYFVTAWYLLTAVYAVLAFLIYKAYKHFDIKLQDSVNENGKFKGDVEFFRLQHEKLTRFLGVADSMLSVYIAITIATIVPLIILTLYLEVYERIDTFTYVVTGWSVALSFVQLLVVFIGGGMVNHVAHGSLGTLYSVDLRNLSEKECKQMSVFLNQLTSNPIGFTALGLFTIDKPTIMTFAGSIATYAVVVIQFKP